MLKLCRITKLKVFFPVLVYVFNFDLFEFSAAILEKGLLLYRYQRITACLNEWLTLHFIIFALVHATIETWVTLPII